MFSADVVSQHHTACVTRQVDEVEVAVIDENQLIGSKYPLCHRGAITGGCYGLLSALSSGLLDEDAFIIDWKGSSSPSTTPPQNRVVYNNRNYRHHRDRGSAWTRAFLGRHRHHDPFSALRGIHKPMTLPTGIPARELHVCGSDVSRSASALLLAS